MQASIASITTTLRRALSPSILDVCIRKQSPGDLMKSLFVLAIAVTTAVALVSTDVADAKRLGAGRSLGMQRNVAPTQPAPSIAPRPGAASDPVMPSQPAAAAPRAAAPAAPARPGRSGWLAPIAG